jgi:preprotein translocase subunit SecD
MVRDDRERKNPHLVVIDGARARRADPIALSLVVHERKRLDIPLHAVIAVEAYATKTFSGERGPVTFDLPHVEVRLMPPMRQKLSDFTKDIVGQAVDLYVRGRCVLQPVVREPLGAEPAFSLSANDFAGAQALAETLRSGWRPVKPVG